MSRKREPGQRRRRWVVVGPGLIIAVVASALILWNQRSEVADRPFVPGSGTVSSPRSSQTKAPIPAVPPAPDLAFVLRQRSALHFSERQSRELSRLETQFGRETEDTRLALDQASSAFTQAMRERGGKRILLPELQERTAAVSQLSRQLSAARRIYWARGARILTSEQRARAEALWVDELNHRGATAPDSPTEQGATG